MATSAVRIFIAIIQNALEILFHGTQNLLKGLGLKGRAAPWITFRLGGDLPYRRASMRLRRLLPRRGSAEWEPDLETFFERLDAVAAAEASRGVVLRLEGLTIGRAKAIAIAGRLRAFRRSCGKTVVVWTAALEGDALTLGLAADRLLVAPAGRVGLKGPALEILTAREALSKIGARVRVVRRGTHKAAAEVFTEDGISGAYRETLEGLLDAAQTHLVGLLCQGRAVDAERARQWIDVGPFTARDALEAELIDGLCYGDEVAESLGESEAAHLAPWPAFAASQKRPLRLRPVITAVPRVAVLSLRGLITEGESRLLPGGSRTCGDRSVAEALAGLRRDERVRAILLRVDSRGGSAHASDLIWHEVARTARKKPVVAWLENVAASGGYYLAAAADEIVAAPLCLTGSIGVIAGLFDFSQLHDRLGLRRELLGRGALAHLGTSSRPPTPEEIAHLDAQVDQLYETFKARVAAGRGLSLEAVEAIAQGRVFPAEVALEHGLIDRLGGFEDAVEVARRRAGARRVELVFHEPGVGGLLALLPGLGAKLGAQLPEAAILRDLMALASLLGSERGVPLPERIWALELARLRDLP